MPAIEEHPSHPVESSHFVRFYDDDGSLQAEVAEFIDVALRAGGTGVVIATPDHIAGLNARLAGLGHSTGGQAWYPGQLIMLDAALTLEQFMVDGRPDLRRFEATVGKVVAQACAQGGAVHAFGEMVALLCAQGEHQAALEVEAMWCELAERLPFALFCGYPWSAFPRAEHTQAFQQVCKAHQTFGEIAAEAKADPALQVLLLEQRNRALEAELARAREAEQTLLRREKELSDFIENAAEGLHRVDASGIILWANRAELEMLGYQRDEYVGHHIAEFHADGPVIGDILVRLKCGQTLYDQPVRLRCKDGSVKHALVHSNGYYEQGELRYTRCFTRDATERYERDQAVAQRERLLEELSVANNAKDEFLAMLGHELRNPLSPIVTALQLMRVRGEPAMERERAIIQRQVDHLVRLVDDLLDVSRVTRGMIELQVEHVELQQPLSKAVEMASPLLDQRRHRFEIDIEPGLWWEGDPMRLAQVVSNLLTNAARYTEPGGHVALRAWRDAEGWLAISVKDNGSGMPPEMLLRVFDLFVQGRRGVERSQGGLGIGLALVKNIVELHGGSVEAFSEGPGTGSEFVVRLPLQSSGAAAGPKALAQPARSPAGRRARFLVVDDNVDAVETLGRLLEALGQEVRVFYEPLAALDIAASYRPDVALLDIGLPVLDGYELAASLRERLGQHRCRMVALTGYGQDADRARSTAAGFDQHLVKPISADQLAALAAAQGS
jgi:PAS domain S-box-containing protein